MGIEPCEKDICNEKVVNEVQDDNEATKDDSKTDSDEKISDKISGIFASDADDKENSEIDEADEKEAEAVECTNTSNKPEFAAEYTEPKIEKKLEEGADVSKVSNPSDVQPNEQKSFGEGDESNSPADETDAPKEGEKLLGKEQQCKTETQQEEESKDSTECTNEELHQAPIDRKQSIISNVSEQEIPSTSPRGELDEVPIKDDTVTDFEAKDSGLEK